MPAALAQALEKVGAGGTATHGDLRATVLRRDEREAGGYLAMLFALRHGAEKQADIDAQDELLEPYARPHADDAAFYATARCVDHLDAVASDVWREFTGRFVSNETVVLDLMASHDSHLPAGTQPTRMVGLGMNAEELVANPALTERVVHDLNAEPALPFRSGDFDLVLCALSIEYLIRPEAVLREARRVLRRGGQCVISFSERWFPPKAVLPWPTLPPFARVGWVLRHLQRAGFHDLRTESLRGLPRPPDDKYFRQTPLADPLYAVWGKA